MSILSVKNLSKRFLLGKGTQVTLREELTNFVKNLRKSREQQHEEFWALKDVSFELEKGDVLGVIGKNGAGKSTLLKILSEITPPTEGTIEYEGSLGSILGIGTGFHPDLTGRENVFLSASIMGMPKEDMKARYKEIVRFSGIEKFIDTPVKHYSNGMYLRLAFSVAFHTDVDILLLDEVLAVGDAEFRMKSFQKIEALAKSGATVVIVSHSVDEILHLCNKCMLLEKGEVKAWGHPQEIMEEYIGETLKKSRAQEAAKREEENAEEVAEEESLSNAEDKIRFEKVEVKAVGKEIGDEMLMSDEIEITFFYEKLQDEHSMEIIMTITTISGVPLLTDSHALRPDYQIPEMPAGKYQLSCKIPANFLNRGMFVISIVFSENTTTPIAELLNIADFKVKVDESDMLKRQWNELINTCLRPYLRWNLLQLFTESTIKE